MPRLWDYKKISNTIDFNRWMTKIYEKIVMRALLDED